MRLHHFDHMINTKNFYCKHWAVVMKKNHFMAAILKIRYYGHHEYICECLHIQKCLFGDSLHVCQILYFYQKVQNFFVKLLH